MPTTEPLLVFSARERVTPEGTRGLRRHREVVVVGTIALGAGLAHLPFLTTPLGSDEGGFLRVAAQWSSGSSLYGDYWVDRPPLLIAFFALADQWGGAIALRLLGIGVVLVAVLASGRIGHLMGASGAEGRSPRATLGSAAAALTAAIFLAEPLFGTAEVNGELISVAAILGSMAIGLSTTRPASAGRAGRLGTAGALAATAVLVKQNQVDAFIFLAGLVAVCGLHATAGLRLRQVGRDVSALVLGAVAMVAVVLAMAALRGTSPLDLWDAVVTFRLDAAAAIRSSASPATGHRLWRLLGVVALSGAPLLVLQLLGRLRPSASSRSTGHDLRWVAVAVLVWEGVSVIAGGSYWLHYLICFVPGLVLAAAVTFASRRPGSRSSTRAFARWIGSPFTALAYCGLVAMVALASTAANPWRGSTEDPTSTWLEAHSTPGDTGLVAYGHPNILQGAGLDSPYPYLWSLIVRVKDPDLSLLATTLAGDDRPDWIVTGPSGLHGWGIDPSAGDEQLTEHYRHVATVEDHVIYLQSSRRLS